MATVLEEARNLLSAGHAELVIPLDEPSAGFALRCSLSGEAAPDLDEEPSPFSTLGQNRLGARGPCSPARAPRTKTHSPPPYRTGA